MTDWTEVRRLHFEEGVPKKELARRFERDIKTIRRALARGRDEPPSPRRPRRLDPYREEIAGWLREDADMTAKDVGKRLRPRLGRISDRTIRKFVAELRSDEGDGGAAAKSRPPATAVTPRRAGSAAPAEPADPSRQRADRPAARPEQGPPAASAPRTPAPRIVGESEAGDPPDLQSSAALLNRELTWLSFDFRVLHEAEDPRNPLLERVKFLSITSSNLDEFFMKRIGGLKQQVGAHVSDLTVDGRTPQQQIVECCAVVRELDERARRAFVSLREELRTRGIALLDYAELAEAETEALREHYIENIFPLVTPQATDPAHPFPFISNLSLNLLVELRHRGDENPSLARVKVPVGARIPRLLQIPGRLAFVGLETVMAQNLDLLFPGMEIVSVTPFRVTRNANTELEEEHAEDLLAMIESELRERKFAPVVRLQVTRGVSTYHRGLLAAELGLDEVADVFEVDGMIGMRDLMELKAHPDLQIADLHDPPHHPVDHPELKTPRSMFHTLRDLGAILVHHPYQSYATSVERFLRAASRDPKVRAIKMTLYRTSAKSKAIEYLIQAARNNKQVAVVVELKARFDEEANIHWASRLEEVGIHVTYGVVGLKTHCKTILVIRQDYNGLRRYAHIGTGNYHAGTARLYSDLGMFTTDDAIGRDLTELFNYLTTGLKPRRRYEKLLPSPKHSKPALLAKIAREIDHHSPASPGLVQIKTNALEDAAVSRALYRAAQAGVHVDLIVRDTCRVRPGVPGLSENIRVISIVGRFLEHARIYYFRNGGEEEYFIGSADCMERNLDSRVEILAPVEPAGMRRDLRHLLDTQLADRRSAWEMQPDGSYVQLTPPAGKSDRGCQQILIDWAEKSHREATRLKRRRPRGIQRRNLR